MLHVFKAECLLWKFNFKESQRLRETVKQIDLDLYFGGRVRGKQSSQSPNLQDNNPISLKTNVWNLLIVPLELYVLPGHDGQTSEIVTVS